LPVLPFIFIILFWVISVLSLSSNTVTLTTAIF
jgi:hypothetical protein